MKKIVEVNKMILEKIYKSPVDAAVGIWEDATSGVDFVNDLRKDWRR